MRRSRKQNRMNLIEISDRLSNTLPRMRERIDAMVGNIEEARQDGTPEHLAVALGVQALHDDIGWTRDELCYLAAVAVSMLPRVEPVNGSH